MKKIDGKTKSDGGLKDISECRIGKSEEPTMEVSVKVIINGEESQISLNDFRALLFKDVKKVDKPKKKVSDIQKLVEDEKLINFFGRPMVQEFVDYWTEMMPNGRKERWQKQKAFDIGRRLKAWAKRDYSSLYKEHKFQEEKTKQDNYLEDAKRKASEENFMNPEEQRRELTKLFKRFGKNRR